MERKLKKWERQDEGREMGKKRCIEKEEEMIMREMGYRKKERKERNVKKWEEEEGRKERRKRK